MDVSTLKRLEEEGRIFVLPIPFGKPVYVVESCSCGSHYDCRTNVAAKRKLSAVEIIGINNTSYGHSCHKIYERPFEVKYISRLGKNVFETLEEAREKARSTKHYKK